MVTVTADDEDDGDSSSPSARTSTTRKIEISTGEALCFGVRAFRPHDDPLRMVRLLACVGDDVLLYGIPLTREETRSADGSGGGGDGGYGEEEREEEAVLLAKTTVGKGYGANVAAYTASMTPFAPASARQKFEPPKVLHYVAVGCENGTVVNFELIQSGARQFAFEKVAECAGHTKAVCAVTFHPRGGQLLSSAKDGTARVFDARTGSELAVLKCEVHDPAGPPPTVPDPSKMKTKDPRMMRRAPQILVRGCAYGDLEGRVMYTVASGKRGPAYLTRWRTLVPLNQANPAAGPPGAPPSSAAPPPTQAASRLSVQQEYRIQCSPVPVSATSLSADGTLLALGSVDGSVSLYDLEKRRAVKHFPEVHDLPVTCVASRPVPSQLMMPGEEEGGVSFDAVSASADNRLGRYTRQRRSRVQPPAPPRSARKRGAVESFLWQVLRVPLLLVLLLVITAVREAMDICGEEIAVTTLVMDSGASAGRCVYREVLWAEEGRVSFVPE